MNALVFLMWTVTAAKPMPLIADNPIASGALMLHPMSEWAVLTQPGWPTRHVPDNRVDLALTSYALPTRDIGIDGALGPVACRFTLSTEDGKTDAAVDEARDKTAACGMGDLTESVVETLGRWRFEIEHERKKKRGRYWLDVNVQFGAGESTASVEVAQSFLASKMPPTPFEGLFIVRPVTPRTRVPPSFASGVPDTSGVCALHFWIDAEGVPTDIGVRECADSVHDAVVKAAWKWRFDPKLVNGEPRDAEFDLVIYLKGRSAH